jgi:hypothetical protein
VGSGRTYPVAVPAGGEFLSGHCCGVRSGENRFRISNWLLSKPDRNINNGSSRIRVGRESRWKAEKEGLEG